MSNFLAFFNSLIWARLCVTDSLSSRALEGMPRHASTHAAGVVITGEPITNYIPVYAGKDAVTTQFTKDTVEELGLLKMDFLGLRNLTVIQNTIDMVKENHGIDVEFDQEMNDPKVYKLWQEGKTFGIFQFESSGIKNVLRKYNIESLNKLNITYYARN